MNVQRCPECGQRLNTNYCDICMKKVPFGWNKYVGLLVMIGGLILFQW